MRDSVGSLGAALNSQLRKKALQSSLVFGHHLGYYGADAAAASHAIAVQLR